MTTVIIPCNADSQNDFSSIVQMYERNRKQIFAINEGKSSSSNMHHVELISLQIN